MNMHRGKTIFSFRLAKRNTQDSRVFLLANLKLKEGYSKSKVWLFRLGFVVRAFLPHGCADLWLTLLRLMDVLITDDTRRTPVEIQFSEILLLTVEFN